MTARAPNVVAVHPSLPARSVKELIALAVSRLQRSPLLPGVVTASESGLPGFEMNPWFGVLAPVGTPREIIVRLNAKIVRFLATPEAAKQFAAHGADVAYSSPEDLLALIKSDLAPLGEVIRDNGIRGE